MTSVRLDSLDDLFVLYDTASLIAPPIELDPEYIAAKIRLKELERQYYAIAYHNYKWLSENIFDVGE